MVQVPNYIQTVSMRLSEVLADIGVDERIVLKRRTMFLIESMTNMSKHLLADNIYTVYYFGSQSEGTITVGMKSDTDVIFCLNNLPVIQDWCDWIPGVPNIVMIQDDSVSLGYSLLQVLSHNAPLPADAEFFFRARPGKLFLKHLILSDGHLGKLKLHGPARVQQGSHGSSDTDHATALHCKTWPQQARQWLDRQDVGLWPSAEMKQYCSRSGCFVVPVGCRGSEHETLEWRISTSLAKRCLMLNLNSTRIRCYVLMKMVIKSFLNPQFEDVISSYMCKTVLFHCIANSHFNIWRGNNFLSCLSLCLYLLYNNIINENCPHFIIPENNLMRGKISPEVKPFILEILNNTIKSKGVALLGIKCDDLGFLLHLKFYNLCPFQESKLISGFLLYNMARFALGPFLLRALKNKSPNEAVKVLTNCISKIFNVQYEGLNKTMCHILDVASSKLKLASILYCIQEIQKSDLILSEIERSYDLQIVEPICSCYDFEIEAFRQEYFATCDNHNEDVIQYATASCFIFLPCEIHCVPTELRYEMLRSSPGDRIFLTKDDDWMDNAVVETLPYLYFLQYKVNSHLGRNNGKQSALSKLLRTIITEPNLGHQETALNILGKCMEQECRVRDALQCYLMSLNLKRRNNAARIHICTLLSLIGQFRAYNVSQRDGHNSSVNYDGRVTYKSKGTVLLNIIWKTSIYVKYF